MKKYIFILSVFVLLMDYCSAQQIFYVADTPCYLQVYEKGEVNVAIASGYFPFNSIGSKLGSQLQFQTAYSPFKNIVVSASFSKYTDENDYRGWSFRGANVDIGIGSNWVKWYESYGFLLDAYFTMAKGHMTNYYGFNSSYVNNNNYDFIIPKSDRFSYDKIGIQLGMHYLIKLKYPSNTQLRMGLILRPALLTYTELRTVLGDVPPYFTAVNRYYYNNTDIFFSSLSSNNRIPIIETTFTIQYSIWGIRLFMNLNHTNNESSNTVFDKHANIGSFQVGTIIELHKLL